MQKTITIRTNKQNGLFDITAQIVNLVQECGIQNGLVSVYIQGATAAIMIQENWDESVQNDVINFLKRIIPAGVWEHDHQDGNGDAHIKAGLVGPSESIPIVHGRLGLSTWQNIFVCEFDGPRERRDIVVSILPV
jgi:secondary thiamine-phosphate synthase enzyme